MNGIRRIIKRSGEGFTLLELLAVIVILSIIAIISVPIFANKGDMSKGTADKTNKKILLKQAQSYIWEKGIKGPQADILPAMITTGYVEKTPDNPWKEDQNYKNKTYKVSLSTDGKPTVKLTDGYDETMQVNKPELVEGMTPIYWDGDSFEATTSENIENQWYIYNGDIDNESDTNKSDGIGAFSADRWANVRLADGSMFVWIPRFTYKITGSGVTGKIEIKYSNIVSDDFSNNFIKHPAFTFGDTELTGIWVAKFEASAREGSGNNNESDNIITKNVQVLPDNPSGTRVQSWRYIQIGNAFTVCRNMQKSSTYGWSNTVEKLDTHLMKNSEWGAAAYLTEAIRDGEQVWNNNCYEGAEPPNEGENNAIVRPGYAGNSANATRSTLGTPIYSYNTAGGAKASTTGNLYGVYDISGGSWERVASYIDNNSTFITSVGASLKNADSKYKDVLVAVDGNFDDGTTVPDEITTNVDDKKMQNNYNITKGQTLGMALHEVFVNGLTATNFRNYSDNQSFPFTTYPFFGRSGGYNVGSEVGIFACSGAFNFVNGHDGFRPVLVALP